MDIICYGFLRSLLLYMITMAIAFGPAWAVYKVMGGGKKKPVVSMTPEIDNFSLAGFVSFLVFLICFFVGINIAHKAMEDICGFSPDLRGYEQESRINQLRHEVDDREAEIRYLESILNDLD